MCKSYAVIRVIPVGLVLLVTLSGLDVHGGDTVNLPNFSNI